MSDRVLVSVEDHVARVRLNRPEKRNGLDLEMFEALAAAAERVPSEPGVRAVVLSGEGRAFCAGLDWMAFLGMADRAVPALLDRRAGEAANLAQKVSVAWAMAPVPVIAAVHGAALGGGLQIALGADLRYVAPDAQLSVMEVRYGLVPDMGLSVLLPRLVRADVARELTFTGRVIDGVEAARLGLATRVCDDPLAAALETARAIAANAPRAVRAAKRLLRDAPAHDPAASLALESELQRALMGTAEQMEAVQAAMEKRAGRFDDP
ncbi:MAG: crotonase/enoyl-CoA hydratase family protein [Polyangiales bacterium]